MDTREESQGSERRRGWNQWVEEDGVNGHEEGGANGNEEGGANGNEEVESMGIKRVEPMGTKKVEPMGTKKVEPMGTKRVEPMGTKKVEPTVSELTAADLEFLGCLRSGFRAPHYYGLPSNSRQQVLPTPVPKLPRYF